LFTYRLYRNGVEVAMLEGGPGLLGDYSVGWAIGARGGVAGQEREWNGFIDDVRMYNHPLTPAEIQSIMIGGPPPVAGDTDGDGIGGEFPDDFTPIQTNFRKSVSMRSAGDLVPNGKVDFDDFRQWKTAFQGMGGSLAGLDLGVFGNVPEPTTVGLMFTAICGVATRAPRRRFAKEKVN
jgi:hypothetical protein